MKLRRNAAGGLAVPHPGGYGDVHTTLEHWLAAVNATPENGWSAESGFDVRRAFRPARLASQWARDRRAWWRWAREEVRWIATVAEGLASYEVAAILQRSVWTARRFIRRTGAYRQRVGPCGRRRWTGRYDFGGTR